MFETFSAFDTAQQIYWGIALIASVIFIIQMISTFVGFDSDTDFTGGDSSFDSDGFHIISVKTIVCFLLGFGWTGALFYTQIESHFLLGAISVAVGLCFMSLIAILMYQVMKLGKDNTFHTSMTIGKIAEVYLHIPAAKSETGKITISINGSLHELEAMTDGEAIPTGAKVKIINAIDEDTVLVEIINN